MQKPNYSKHVSCHCCEFVQSRFQIYLIHPNSQYSVWHRVVISRIHSLTGRMERIRGEWYSHPTLNIALIMLASSEQEDVLSHALVLPLHFSFHDHKLYTSVKTHVCVPKLLTQYHPFCLVICYSLGLGGPFLIFICLASLHSS